MLKKPTIQLVGIFWSIYLRELALMSDDKWGGWIRACVFSGALPVLVYGSPREEVAISRGLKQGDRLA
jgi:hypothetical protein